MKKSAGYELADKTGLAYLNDKFVGNNWAQMPCFLVEMGYMSNVGEDIKLATECKKPVTLCNRAGGIIPSPEEVLAAIIKANENGGDL